MTLFHLFYLFLFAFFSFFVISARNPIHSVLSLVCLFILSSTLLLSLEVEFLALSFVIIYVGAIAILFLFVIMMLDIKIIDHSFDFLIYSIPAYFISFSFFFEIYLSSFFLIFPSSDNSLPIFFSIPWSFLVDSFSNINLLGLTLYTHFYIYFLLAGFILLIAVFGVLMLLVSYNKAGVTPVFSKKVKREYFVFSETSLNIHK